MQILLMVSLTRRTAVAIIAHPVTGDHLSLVAQVSPHHLQLSNLCFLNHNDSAAWFRQIKIQIVIKPSAPQLRNTSFKIHQLSSLQTVITMILEKFLF